MTTFGFQEVVGHLGHLLFSLCITSVCQTMFPPDPLPIVLGILLWLTVSSVYYVTSYVSYIQGLPCAHISLQFGWAAGYSIGAVLAYEWGHVMVPVIGSSFLLFAGCSMVFMMPGIFTLGCMLLTTPPIREEIDALVVARTYNPPTVPSTVLEKEEPLFFT